MQKLTIKFLFPLPSDYIGISYTCLTYAQYFNELGHDVSVITPRIQGKANSVNTKHIMCLPNYISFLPYRYFHKYFQKMIESKFVRCINKGDIAYLWSHVTPECVKKLKEKGAITLREKFSCHLGFVKDTLDTEYKALNLIPDHGITEEKINEEKHVLELVDYVISPNPEHKKTLINNGVDETKIISCSYGWDPKRFAANPRPNRDEASSFIFVGSGVIGKGLHILLETWAKAKLQNKLIIAGGIAPELKYKYAQVLQMPNVQSYDYVENIGDLYKSADVFVFPTLGEGGPLVTYEAMGNSLAVIVSQMGAGAIARHDIDGFIIDPHDYESWICAFKKFAIDKSLVSSFQKNSFERAKNYTWGRVAEQRIKSIIEIIDRKVK